MNLRDRLDAVAADLTAQEITWVLDTKRAEERSASWVRVAETTPRRLAVAWVDGGRWMADGSLRNWGYQPVEWLDVSYDCESVETGEAIAEAFRSHGFTVDWSGSPTRAVSVRLTDS